jgi:predicted protein tyrosine phosphatase
MPWIQNISLAEAATGGHPDPGSNAMLIQILSAGRDFPKSPYPFKETYRFHFSDIEDNHPRAEAEGITDRQAAEIARVLVRALRKGMNVIVHCHAGIYRSGAVCDVGTLLGFYDTQRMRIPNKRVRSKLIVALQNMRTI